MIASAVVIPEEPLPPGDQDGTSPVRKRRQSSVSISSESSKRPRLDRDGSNSTAGAPPPQSPRGLENGRQPMSPPRPADGRRRPSSQTVEQDKSRNRRLFGALLGPLSQPSSRLSKSGPAGAIAARNSRRDEIESRQRERLKRETEEMEAQVRRKREDLDRQRRLEQTRWDEEGTQLRHRNLKAMAGFLRTKTEPCLYYKPWELRDHEVDTIKRQTEDVEETIRRELGQAGRPHETTASATEGSPHARKSSATVQSQSSAGDVEETRDPRNGKQAMATTGGQEDSHARIPEPSTTASDPDGPVPETNGSVGTKDEAGSASEMSPDRSRPDDRPSSKDDDHGGEELERGQEDDVIY